MTTSFHGDDYHTYAGITGRFAPGIDRLSKPTAADADNTGRRFGERPCAQSRSPASGSLPNGEGNDDEGGVASQQRQPGRSTQLL
jgi:hypothetical protein